MSVKKTCLTCKYEPYWRPTTRDPQTKEGQCQFYPTKKQVREMGLPQGCQVSPPWLRDNSVKMNCPAWKEKEAAYNRAQFLPERRKMMQAWADYLDALKAGNTEAACV